MTAATFTEISNSSDALWEAVCLYEDGFGEKADEIAATLSEADRRIYAEEVADLYRKWGKALDAKPRHAARFYGPAATATDAEARILDRQDVFMNGEIA